MVGLEIGPYMRSSTMKFDPRAADASRLTEGDRDPLMVDRLAGRMRAWKAGALGNVGLQNALGLPATPKKWRVLERDRHLCVAFDCVRGPSETARAKELAGRWRDFLNVRWPRHQRGETILGSPLLDALLAAACEDPTPIGSRQMLNIVRQREALSVFGFADLPSNQSTRYSSVITLRSSRDEDR